MAYRKKSVKRTFKRKTKRGKRVRQGIKSHRTQNYYVVNRWTQTNGFGIPAGSTSYALGNTFQLSDMSDYTTYQSLFDQFKIRGVVMRIRQINNPDGGTLLNLTTPNPFNFFIDGYITVDHDDATAPVSDDQMLQYSKCKQFILKPGQWTYYKCRPTPANTVNGGFAVGSKSQWLDTSTPTIPHYGLKTLLKLPVGLSIPAGVSCYFEVQFKYDIIFKNAR